MAGRAIIWTEEASKEFQNILEYYVIRNQSTGYAVRLHRLVESLTDLIASYPNMGRITSRIGIRKFPILDFIIFYQVEEKAIVIISFSDSRQNQ